MQDETLVALGEDYPELRESVRKICARYPGTYWSGLEEKEAYPTAFINELTEAGFLGALIPEEYGGSGLPLRAAAVILEEINASGCVASSWRSRARSACSVSACELTETYSPAAIDSAPAKRPATPAISTSWRAAFAAATPTTRLAVETMPSLAPSTAARSHPIRSLRCHSRCAMGQLCLDYP